MTTDPIHHHQMKHIKIDIHFFHQMVTLGHVHALCVLSMNQFANIMMKGLIVQLVTDFT